MILKIDEAIFFFFQDLQRPWLDYFLAWPTYFGHTIVALSLTVGGIVLFDKSRNPEKISFATLGILATYWTTQAAKLLFNRPRPHVFFEYVNVIFDKPLNNAFPSGHTSIVFAAAFMLNYLYPDKARWTYAVAVWVAVTRLYVGAHYPTDLLGGAVLGMASAAFACFVFKRLRAVKD